MDLHMVRKAKAYFDSREAERERRATREEIIGAIRAVDDSRLDTCAHRAQEQYRLLRKYQGFFYKRLYDVASLAVLVLRRADMLRGAAVSRGFPTPDESKAVYLGCSSNDGIMPQELAERYDIVCEPFLVGRLLNSAVVGYWEESTADAKRSPFFRAQALVYLANVAHAIWTHRPAAIITTSESSFACSLITGLCRKAGVEHICIMHGEKLIQPGTAFFEVDTFYVWDGYYADLFASCGANVGRYIVSNPWTAQRCASDGDGRRLTYYLQLPPHDMRGFADMLGRFEAAGWRVKVRPHPSDIESGRYKRYFDADRIEDGRKVGILDSIDGADMVVSQYSTVLFQAWSRGVAACIDDVSDPGLFENVVDKRFIMLEREHALLSELLDGLS